MFKVKTGVRPGCVLSTPLFKLVFDWVLSCSTEDKKRGIQWTLFTTLENLDYADDQALVSHRHQDMQEKTDRHTTFASQFGLCVNTTKTEVIVLNINNPTPMKHGDKDLKYVDCFTIMEVTDRGADQDIHNRLGKARTAFRMLDQVWRSSQYSYKTSITIRHKRVNTFHTKNP